MNDFRKMAKNFASVLDALRAAGEEKAREVDNVYALNCEWLLEQFKHTQASLLSLAVTHGAAAPEIPEQQVPLVYLLCSFDDLLTVGS